MGTDNLHHKKRLAKSYERKPGRRPAGKRYLIVCEGAKSEPHYFKEIRHELRLQTATIDVCGKECGSDPVSVFKYAAKLCDDEKHSAYDSVFCVIDTDDHANLSQALELIDARGKPFQAVVSSPCFEYWLLLHHSFHRSSFRATGTKSIGEVVESALRKHDGMYQKGKPGLWSRYKDKLEVALSNSKAIHKTSRASGNKNPSTDIHFLVEALVALKSN